MKLTWLKNLTLSSKTTTMLPKKKPRLETRKVESKLILSWLKTNRNVGLKSIGSKLNKRIMLRSKSSWKNFEKWKPKLRESQTNIVMVWPKNLKIRSKNYWKFTTTLSNVRKDLKSWLLKEIRIRESWKNWSLLFKILKKSKDLTSTRTNSMKIDISCKESLAKFPNSN